MVMESELTGSALRRLKRERETVSAMIQLHCTGVHGTREGLCTACRELSAYADQRIDHCPFRDDKPTCVNCPIHCYKPERREQIRQVMRYAGPRMLKRHPLLALLHLFDGKKPAPARPGPRADPTPER